MNANQLYDAGYSDGYHDVEQNIEHFLEDNYQMGLVDGRADREAGVKTMGVKSAFINDDFIKNNDPPVGYIFKSFGMKMPLFMIRAYSVS